MSTLDSFIDRLRAAVHQVAIKATHLTAPAPMIIRPAPVVPNWRRKKADLMFGYDLSHNQDGRENSNKRNVIDASLDNAVDRFKPARFEGDPNSNDALNDLILTASRKILGNLIAFEIIGVQPIRGVVGQIHVLRVTSGEERTRISLIKEVVEVRARKLSARFNCDHDVMDYVRDELVAALISEATAELDQQLLQQLGDVAGEPVSVFDMNTGARSEHTFVGDVHAGLAVQINRASNMVAKRSHRGSASWCIVSPVALTILQSATTSAFARTDQEFGPKNFPHASIKYVGILNNSMSVFCNPYAHDAEPVLVGYRGSDQDAPAIYAPHTVLSSPGMLIDSATFEPTCSFTTHGALYLLPRAPNTIADAADMLSRVGINAHSLTFI